MSDFTPIKARFTIHVTEADIQASNRTYKDTSYTNPIAKAVKREFGLTYGQTARMGAGYGDVYYEEEQHKLKR